MVATNTVLGRRQKRQSSDPDIRLIRCVGDKIERFEIVAKNYRENAAILVAGIDFTTTQNVSCLSDSNFFDLINFY